MRLRFGVAESLRALPSVVALAERAVMSKKVGSAALPNPFWMARIASKLAPFVPGPSELGGAVSFSALGEGGWGHCAVAEADVVGACVHQRGAQVGTL